MSAAGGWTGEGGCACGSVRYRLRSGPLFVNCCHCLDCQRQTGSAFAINLMIEADRVELLEGTVEPVEVPREGRLPQTILRCPTCRVAVWSRYTLPELLFVRAGTLDAPSSVEPDVHIYVRSKVPWVALPAGVPAVPEYYDRKALWPAESNARFDALRRGPTG